MKKKLLLMVIALGFWTVVGAGGFLSDEEIRKMCDDYGLNLKQKALLTQQCMNIDREECKQLLAYIRCYMKVEGWEGKAELKAIGGKIVGLLVKNKREIVDPFFHPDNCTRADDMCIHFVCTVGTPLVCKEETPPQEPVLTSEPIEPPPAPQPVVEPVPPPEPLPPPVVEARLRDCPLIWDTDTVLVFKEALPDVAPPYFICGDTLLNNWCFQKPGKTFEVAALEKEFKGFELTLDDFDEDGNVFVDASTRKNLFGFLMQPGKRWNILGCRPDADGKCEQVWSKLDSYTGSFTRQYNCNIVRGSSAEGAVAPLTLPVCGQTKRWGNSTPSTEQNQK